MGKFGGPAYCHQAGWKWENGDEPEDGSGVVEAWTEKMEMLWRKWDEQRWRAVDSR